MLAHDFGNGGGADAVTEIAVYDNAGGCCFVQQVRYREVWLWKGRLTGRSCL